jgi:hypothetical protein
LGETTGEAFPIVVPQGVGIAPGYITGFGRLPNYFSTVPTVVVPAGETGFVLEPGASISGLIIDGQSNAAVGITASMGAAGNSIIADVRRMTTACIVVDSQTAPPAGITTQVGGSAIQCGTVGLDVRGHAIVELGGTFYNPDFRAEQSEYGIRVSDVAAASLPVSVGPFAYPSVVELSGCAEGLRIAPDPTLGPPAQSAFLQSSFVHDNDAGIHLMSGARFKLRNSSITCGAGGPCVLVSSSQDDAGTDDLRGIDLGSNEATADTGPDYGHNVFSGGGSASTLCAQLSPSAGTLTAEGNTFANGAVQVDCTKGGTLVRSPSCTSGFADIGGLSPNDGTSVDGASCH